MLNKSLLVGNLTKDPEVRYTPSGKAVCNLKVATSRKFKTKSEEDREEKLFITATIWGKRAENCGEYLKKGSPVFIEGRLTTNSFEDREGQQRSNIELQIENIQFLTRVKEGTSPDGK